MKKIITFLSISILLSVFSSYSYADDLIDFVEAITPKVVIKKGYTSYGSRNYCNDYNHRHNRRYYRNGHRINSHIPSISRRQAHRLERINSGRARRLLGNQGEYYNRRGDRPRVVIRFHFGVT